MYRIPPIMAVLLLSSVMISCSGQVKQAAFKGQWRVTTENAIAATKEEGIVSVVSDGQRFRIENPGYTTVYDGVMLHTSDVEQQQPSIIDGMVPSQDTSIPSASSAISSRKPEVSELNGLQFWKCGMTDGKKSTGGTIAGQETVLYEVRSTRPEGEVTIQNWVDAKTGILLRSVTTIYSTQIEQVVMRTTRECFDIAYGPVTDSFSRP
jgi:hypothetical protein